MQKIERRSVGLCEVRFADDGTRGEFSGYASIFGNKDAYGTSFAKGAFKRTLREWEDRGKYPPMLLQHGAGFLGGADDDVPIGKYTHMEENSKGLKVEGKLFALGTDRGQYILEAMREGALDGLSVAFFPRKFENGNTAKGEPRMTFTDVDLREVSVVTFPANDRARIGNVRSMTVEELRDLETALRDAELSRATAAKAVAVFKTWLQRDAGAPINLPRDEDRPAPTATNLADVIRTARKVRAGMLASR
jgi:HK97 family phage prohead protease